MAKMIKCKTCGAEIAKSAKRCPACGAKQHQGVYVACIIIIVISIFLCVSVSSESDEPAKDSVQTSEIPNNTESNSNQIVNNEIIAPEFEAIAETISTWEITLTDFNFADDVEASWLTSYTPEDGCQFAVANLTVTNMGRTAEIFAPIIAINNDITVKIIYGEYEYTATYLIGGDENLLNKQFNPLVSVSGIIVFNVPEAVYNSEEPLVLRFAKGNNVVDFPIR